MRSYGTCLLVIAACGSSPGRSGADASTGGDATTAGDASLQITCNNPAVVSFQTDVAPLINHCSGDACHNILGQPLTWPRTMLVNAPSNCNDHRVLVKPGDPAASYLIQKLSGVNMCGGVRMPMRGTYFSDANMRKIEDWICQGAADN